MGDWERSEWATALVLGGAALQLLGYGVTVLGLLSHVGFLGENNPLTRGLAQMRVWVAWIKRRPTIVQDWWRSTRWVRWHFVTPWGWRPPTRTVHSSVWIQGTAAAAAGARANAGSPVVTLSNDGSIEGRLTSLESRIDQQTVRIDDLAQTTRERLVALRSDISGVREEVTELDQRLHGLFDSEVKLTLVGVFLFVSGILASTVGALLGS
ncbi:MAG: hypothetical protein AAGA90_15680 [Actinomycetota bacterium]